MPKVRIAIDPGSQGGIAHAHKGIVQVQSLSKMTDASIRDYLQDIVRNSYEDPIAYIERVASGAGFGGKSSFTFGQAFGRLKMALCCCYIGYEEVLPNKWQQIFPGLPKGKANTKARKREIKARVETRFPTTEGITLENADALGILLWAMDNKN